MAEGEEGGKGAEKGFRLSGNRKNVGVFAWTTTPRPMQGLAHDGSRRTRDMRDHARGLDQVAEQYG